MYRHASGLIVAMLVLGGVAVFTRAPEQSPVFVKAASGDAFSDPSKGLQDSVQDIVSNVRDRKAISIAPSEKASVAVLEVLARRMMAGSGLAMGVMLSYFLFRAPHVQRL
jgi:hypothetical protein